MFEVMNTGYEAPIPKGLVHKYTFDVTQFPTSTFLEGLGSSESGDLIISANNDVRAVIYSKDNNGEFKYKQSASNSGALGGYPVTAPGGFVVATPSWPTQRGALAVWERQADGTYVRTAQPRETASPYGQLGSQGGLAAVGDWLFSGVNFDGSILITFNKTGGIWSAKNYVTKPGAAYFASRCIRSLSSTEIVTSAPYEAVNSKNNAGAVYVMNITASGSVEKQRIAPPTAYTTGLFGSSIAVISPNRFVVTGKSESGNAIFYTYDRPTSTEPFVHVSTTPVPITNMVNSNNLVHYKGLLFIGNSLDDNNKGACYTLSINDGGLVTYLPDLKLAGGENGENFGILQTVIGNQLFCASSWRTHPSTRSGSIRVYDINA